MTKTMDRIEAIERLNEIRDEIGELVHEAKDILKSQNDDAAATGNAYWYAQIVCALSDDHDYIGGSMCTLQGSINGLYPRLCEICGDNPATDEDEICDDCADETDEEGVDDRRRRDLSAETTRPKREAPADGRWRARRTFHLRPHLGRDVR
jgi:hypothetical protein